MRRGRRKIQWINIRKEVNGKQDSKKGREKDRRVEVEEKEGREGRRKEGTEGGKKEPGQKREKSKANLYIESFGVNRFLIHGVSGNGLWWDLKVAGDMTKG